MYPAKGLMILLGQYVHYKTKYSQFKGNDMTVFLDSKEYDGNLVNQLERRETFIQNHLKLETKITVLKKEEHYEIPMQVIREAIVNAKVHRDYSNEGRSEMRNQVIARVFKELGYIEIWGSGIR